MSRIFYGDNADDVEALTAIVRINPTIQLETAWVNYKSSAFALGVEWSDRPKNTHSYGTILGFSPFLRYRVKE